jgi:hypothetical protein
MKLATRFALLAAVIAAGIWAWNYFFPAPQKIMERNLLKLARLASFPPNEGNFKKLADIERIRALLAENIHVVLDVSNGRSQAFDNREELLQAALAARAAVKGLKVDFSEINIIVNADRQSAVATLTLQAKIAGEADSLATAVKFTFNKTNDEWLVRRIEPMKALR